MVLGIVNTNAAPGTGYDLWAGGITNGLTNYNDSATGDGYPNLLKYATGSNPTNADNLAQMNSGNNQRVVRAQFNRDTNATDLTLIIEGACTSTNDAIWNGIATNIHGSWGATTNYTKTPPPIPPASSCGTPTPPPRIASSVCA